MHYSGSVQWERRTAMPNNWFRFKQFMVKQEGASMKVGTDGVLLGAWASPPCKNAQILDIGTGTGLIALMLAQSFSDCHVTAIEIEKNSYDQARENIEESPFSERISVKHISLQEFSGQEKQKYDLLVSNPPYFRDSLKASSTGRTLARHQDSLTAADLISHSSLLLKPETGILALILPAEQKEKIIELAGSILLFPRRILNIRPNPEKEFKRCLVDFSFREETLDEEEMYIELSRHNYSEKYIQLTRDFYPAMD